MENVAQTKLRLVREAVQDNVARGRYCRISVSAPRRRFPIGLVSVFLTAILVYLPASEVILRRAAGSPVVPVERVNRSVTGAGNATARPEISEPSIHTPRVPGTPPRPLDRVVFPLSVRKVVIDPGHGGAQHGAVSESGMAEKEISLDIALRLRRLLEGASFEVLMTRETDEAVGLDKRADFANASSADLFVSIHLNWIPRQELRALETYVLGPTNDPAVTKLAARENRDSVYSLSEYRLLLERIYMDTRQDESRRLAKAIQAELFGSVRRINPLVEDRGVKTAPFVVLVRTEMPAILVEVSCLSNQEEVKLLTNDDYRENIAQALFRGIISYADNLKGSEEKVPKNGRKE